MKKSILPLSIQLCLLMAVAFVEAQVSPVKNSSEFFSRTGEFPVNGELLQMAAPYSQSYPSVAFNGSTYMVVWEDYRDQESDIYGARLDINGNLLDPVGLIICNAPESQSNPAIATDGESFFVVWREERNEDSEDDIYGARVSPEGLILDPGGIAICTAVDDQYDPAVACIGNNFCVTWSDFRVNGNYDDIYANFVSTDGTVSHVNGFPLCTHPAYQSYPDICSNGSHYFVVWGDGRNGNDDIFGTFIETDGTVSNPDGIVITGLPNDQGHPSIYHGGGQYFLAWEEDPAAGNEMIRGSRVNMSGTLLDPNGLSISSYPDLYCVWPDVNFDGINFWIAFEKGNYGINYDFDVLVSRISADGQVMDPQGIIVAAAEYREERASLAFDGQKMLICRQEERNNLDLYRSFGDLQGNITPAEGTLITHGFNNQLSGKIGFDGTNYLAIWLDTRNDNSFDIFGARVNQSGNVVDQEALPIITGEGNCFHTAICFNGTHYLIAWERNSDLYGVRITTDGQVMAPGEIVIYQGNWIQTRPAIASDGTNWMVVWEDDRNSSGSSSHSDIFGTLINPDGVAVHPGGLPIIAYQEDQQNCSIVFDGTNYILVWEDYRAGFWGEAAIYGARLSPDATVLDASGIALAVNEDRPMENPVLAYSENVLITCFTETIYSDNVTAVKFVRFNKEMALIDSEPVVINPSSTQQYNPLVVPYTDKFLVIWLDNTDTYLNHMEKAVISTEGDILETGLFSQIGAKMKAPSLARGPNDQALCLFSSFTEISGEETVNALRLYGKQYGQETGIADNPDMAQFEVMPNPTLGKFQITNPKTQLNSRIQIQNLEVVDLYGKVVKEIACDLDFGAWNLEFNISDVPSGIYFIRINVDNQWIVKKIIKL